MGAQSSCSDEEDQMMDVILLALCAALFAVSVGYAYACERL
jgi:hypothetical protein